jgi:Protein of unknown function (DUF2442)
VHLEITAAEYVPRYKIALRFVDATRRTVDFGPFLTKAHNPDTTDYQDLEKFKTFRLEDGDLMWGDFQMIFPITDLYKGEI